MKYLLLTLLVLKLFANEWMRDIDTQRLYLCDRVVGAFYDSNKQEIYDLFAEYEDNDKEDIVLNHFFFMMNNCITELRKKYPDASIDESLIQSLDWIQFIQPLKFKDDNRELSYLTIEEMEVKGKMHQEKQMILENVERNMNGFSKFLRDYHMTEKSVAIIAIVIIMSIFFYNFIKAMKFLITEQIKQDEKNEQKKKKKIM